MLNCVLVLFNINTSVSEQLQISRLQIGFTTEISYVVGISQGLFTWQFFFNVTFPLPYILNDYM